MTTLTVDQHKQAVKLGIAHRTDGLWGFKKKCANKKCDKVLDGHCYAAEHFSEAEQEVQLRSAYTCSKECFAASGNMYDFVSECYDDSDLATIGECGLDDVKRLKRRLKSGTTDGLVVKDKKIIFKWFQDISENFDGGEQDEFEVGCEV